MIWRLCDKQNCEDEDDDDYRMNEKSEEWCDISVGRSSNNLLFIILLFVCYACMTLITL